MDALIGLVGSKKKANALVKNYLKLTGSPPAGDIGAFMDSLETELFNLEEAVLNSGSPAEQAKIVNRAMRLALTKCSIRSMGGKAEHNLISSMVEYGLFTPAQAIQVAAQQKHASFTYSALIDLAPLLDKTHLNAAIDVANGISDEYRRQYALACLIHYLDDARRTEWAQRLLDELPSPLEGQKYVEIYLPLLPYIAPHRRSGIIPELLQIMRKRTTVRIGLALLPLLAWIEDAPVAALWSPFAELTKMRFPMHLEDLPDENETRLEAWQTFGMTLSMQDMVDGIQRGAFKDDTYYLLPEHLNRLPAESRARWFKPALESAQAITRQDKRWHKAIVLAQLAAWSASHNLLSAGERDELLAEAVSLAWSEKDRTNRSQALVHVAHCLPPAEQLPLLQQALKKMGVPRWAVEARALKLALPLLPENEARTWLGKVLKKAGKLNDAPHRYAASIVLNPASATVDAKSLDALVKAWKDAARDNADDLILADLLPHLPPDEQAARLAQILAQTRAENWPRAKAMGLRRLLPLLAAKDRAEALTTLTDTALGLSRQTEIVSISAEVGKPEELSRLVGLVAAEQKPYIVEAALNAMLAMNKSWQRGAASSMYALDYFLHQLQRMFPRLEPEMAAHVWQITQKELAEYDSWPAAALLCPHLPPTLAAEANSRLIATLTAPLTAADDPPIYARISATTHAKSLLPGDQWDTAFKEAQLLALQIKKPVFRTRALLKLWPHFTGEESYLALRNTLNTLETIPDLSYRRQELFHLIKQVANQPLPQAGSICVRLLRLGAILDRPELLKALRRLTPVLSQLEVGPDAARSVDEIGTFFA